MALKRKQQKVSIWVSQIRIITWRDYHECNKELIDDFKDEENPAAYKGQTPEEYINMVAEEIADEYSISEIKLVETQMICDIRVGQNADKVIATIHYIKRND